MAKGLATKSEVQVLRALAADPTKASATQTAYFDLMAHDLTVADACDALWHWIAVGRPVTRTTPTDQQEGGNHDHEPLPSVRRQSHHPP